MTLPIVGARHRPPADQILNDLPPGTALVLIREPGNQYDPNAIMVCLPAGWEANLEPEALRAMRENVSLVGGTWPTSEIFQLGYVPKGLAAVLAPEMDEKGEAVEGTLAFDVTGKPAFQGPEEEEEEDEPAGQGETEL